MVETRPVTKAQASLLERAQQQINVAQSQLDLVAATILAGLEIEGRVVSLDSGKLTLTIDVKDEDKAET